MNGLPRGLAVAVALAAAAPAASAAPKSGAAAPKSAAAASARACSPAGAQTVAEDREARVYSLGARSRTTFTPGGPLYGCLKRSGRTTSLGMLDGRQRVAREALTGHMVALARQDMGIDTLSSAVDVLDLASGRTVHQQAATGPVRAPESVVLVYGMALDARGNLAWLASQHSIIGQSTSYEVRRVNSAGAALLDAGPSIAPGSLRRHGETVVWGHGASQRSARLA